MWLAAKVRTIPFRRKLLALPTLLVIIIPGIQFEIRRVKIRPQPTGMLCIVIEGLQGSDLKLPQTVRRGYLGCIAHLLAHQTAPDG